MSYLVGPFVAADIASAVVGNVALDIPLDVASLSAVGGPLGAAVGAVAGFYVIGPYVVQMYPGSSPGADITKLYASAAVGGAIVPYVVGLPLTASVVLGASAAAGMYLLGAYM